jgi:DNA-binding HxlR family transcriptional regulator
MGKSKRRSDCAINFVLELFGDRWTLLIVRDLMFQGKQHYGEFLEAEENIATNILADRLAMLEREGIVTKSVDPAHGSKFIYKLSSSGIDLLPILLEYIVWSARHDPGSGVDMKFVNRIRRDREGVLKEISSRLKKELSAK